MSKDSSAKKGPGYEERDISARQLLIYGTAGLVILLGIAYITVTVLYSYYEKTFPQQSSAVSFFQSEDDDRAPDPRLEIHPSREREAMDKREEEWTHSYGWVDYREGIARIPLELALKQTAEKGLPYRKGSSE